MVEKSVTEIEKELEEAKAREGKEKPSKANESRTGGRKQDNKVIVFRKKTGEKDGKVVYEDFSQTIKNGMLSVRTTLSKPEYNGEVIVIGNGRDVGLAIDVAVSKNISEVADVKDTKIFAEDYIPKYERDKENPKARRRSVIEITLKKK